MSHELTITREVDVPAETLYRAWTEPSLLTQWFCPKPWKATVADLEVRAGGRMDVTMEGPDGERNELPGVFLEVVPNERLVFTDAYRSGWIPNEKPFMTGVVTFESLGPDRTRYTATARHWTAADKEAHVEMGFEPGWNAALDQLVELAATL
jgi:uncharacterized protein YndB with AHSA1/START domain